MLGKFKNLNFCGQICTIYCGGGGGGGGKCLESSDLNFCDQVRRNGVMEQNMQMMLESVTFILTQKVQPGRAGCLSADQNFCSDSDSLFTKFYNKESVSKVFMISCRTRSSGKPSHQLSPFIIQWKQCARFGCEDLHRVCFSASML